MPVAMCLLQTVSGAFTKTSYLHDHPAQTGRPSVPHDLHVTMLAVTQVAFFEVVALPLFNSLAAVLPGAHWLQKAAAQNYYRWMSQLDAT